MSWDPDAIVADTLPSGHFVSTRWLADTKTRVFPLGPLRLYQTYVTGPDHWDGYSVGYATVDEAVAGHRLVVQAIGLDLDLDRSRQ